MRARVDMSELKNKINFTVACVDEFAQKNNLSVKDFSLKALNL